MPGSFAYVPATNIATVTAGTSGSPATPTDFVTADRAGTLNAVDARNITGVDGAPVAVTRAIRPVERLILGGATAQTLYIVVTNWNGTTATINVAGTDYDGTSQNENIVITGNGIYYTTLRYKTVTTTRVTVFTATSFTYTLTQKGWGVIWDKGDNQYQVDSKLTVGDGSTSTWFTSKKEMVVFSAEADPSVVANATLQIGALIGSFGVMGSYWRFKNPTNNYSFCAGGTLLLYDSILHNDGLRIVQFNTGTLVGINSTLENEYNVTDTDWKRFWNFNWSMNASLVNCYSNSLAGLNSSMNISPFTDFRSHNSGVGFQSNLLNAAVVIVNPQVSSSVTADYATGSGDGSTLLVIDPVTPIMVVKIGNDSGLIAECYSVNIHIADKDGNNLSNASVTVQDKNGNIVSYLDSGANTNEVVDSSETDIDVTDGTKFAIGQYILIDAEWMSVDNVVGNTLTVTRAQYSSFAIGHKNGADIYTAQALTTDSNGNTSQFNIHYKTWQGTSKTLLINSPHKFTISKAGYQTLVLENITVSSAIKWHLELQDVVEETISGGRKFFIYPEPEMVPIPIPVQMIEGNERELTEKSPDDMTQREFEAWRKSQGAKFR